MAGKESRKVQVAEALRGVWSRLPIRKKNDVKGEAVKETGAEAGLTAAAGTEKKKKEKKSFTPAQKKKRKKIRILIIIGVAILAIVILLIALLGGKGSDEAELVTDIVSYGSITSTVEGSGMTKAKDSKAITLTTAGTVEAVYVTEGEVVTAGQKLFTVDSPAARTAVQTAQSEVNGYQKQLKSLQKDLAGLNLTAPFGGKLTEAADLHVGDSIAKGDKVATLVDDTKMRLEQYYSYAYSGQVKAGQKVTVSVPAYMTSVSGTVESVHMVSRVTPEGSKLFEADIVISNPGTLTAGMTASATISGSNGAVYPYEVATLEYNRVRELTSTVEGTVASLNLREYMNVGAGQTLLRIEGDDSENEVFNLQQQLETARKDLEAAQENLDNMNAVAPIDGMVIGLSIAQGDELSGTATAAVTIADTSTILIEATVDERNISFVKAGMMVDIDQWGNLFSGTVESVSLNSKVENEVASYPMVISVDNGDGSLMTGSSVTYSLVASQNDNCLVLPIQSVKSVTLADGSTASVVFVKGSKPKEIPELAETPEDVPKGFWPVLVETGISDNYNVEIKSGVEEGTEVFTQVVTTSTWM